MSVLAAGGRGVGVGRAVGVGVACGVGVGVRRGVGGMVGPGVGVVVGGGGAIEADGVAACAVADADAPGEQVGAGVAVGTVTLDDGNGVEGAPEPQPSTTSAVTIASHAKPRAAGRRAVPVRDCRCPSAVRLVGDGDSRSLAAFGQVLARTRDSHLTVMLLAAYVANDIGVANFRDSRRDVGADRAVLRR